MKMFAVHVCWIAVALLAPKIFPVDGADTALQKKPVVSWVETEVPDAVEAWTSMIDETRGVTLELFLRARTAAEINRRSNLPHIKSWVDAKIANDYKVNIMAAFQLLGRVADLLRIAYAGCKGFNCQVAVAQVYSDYQDMVAKSLIISELFVTKSLKALKYHRLAEKKRKQEKYARTVKYIERCYPLAQELEKAAMVMVNMSETLKEEAVKAFKLSGKEDVRNRAQIKLFDETLANITAKNAKISETRDQLRKEIKAVHKQMAGVTEEAKRYADEYNAEAIKKVKTNKICKVTSVPVIKVIFISIRKKVTTCFTKLDPEAVKLQRVKLTAFERKMREARNRYLIYLRHKQTLEKELIGLLGELGAGLKVRSSALKKGSELQRAAISLEMSIRVLSMVKTLFLEYLSFWERVVQNSEQQGAKGVLAKMLDDMKEDIEEGEADDEELKEILVESGMNWLTLAKACSDAAIGMQEVKRNVTRGFIDLPDYKQSILLVESSKSFIDETEVLINNLMDVMTKRLQVIDDGETANKMIGKLSKPDTARDDCDDDKSLAILLSNSPDVL